MKYYLILIIFTVCCFAGCTPQQGVPTEFSKACSFENEKKYLEISGYLSPGSAVYCSNRSGRMDCSYDFRETPTGAKRIGADLEAGTGANTAEEIKSSYTTKDIKIRDNNSQLINLAEKVKLTGQMSITPDGSVCFMKVTKIEK